MKKPQTRIKATTLWIRSENSSFEEPYQTTSSIYEQTSIPENTSDEGPDNKSRPVEKSKPDVSSDFSKDEHGSQDSSNLPEAFHENNLEDPGKSISENNDYEILDVLGETRVCKIYKVRNRLFNGFLAMKVLKDEFRDNAAAERQFAREISASITLCHSNIVPVYGHGQLSDNSVFLVEPLVENGKDLSQILKSEGPLTAERSLSLFVQIADAMIHAHSKGIVHGDIKPSNVLISKNQDAEKAVVIDFGMAVILQSARCEQVDINRTGEIFGTPEYMSPEQCLGNSCDERSDIYSFGCLMYKTLTGYPPFMGLNPVQLITHHLYSEPPEFDESINSLALYPELEIVIRKCLEKKQEDRYQSFQDLKSDLEDIIQGKSTSNKIFFKPADFLVRAYASLADCAILASFYLILAPLISKVAFTDFTLMIRNKTAPWLSFDASALISFMEGLSREIPLAGGLILWPPIWPSIVASSNNQYFTGGVFILIAILYFLLFELSPLSATPGKLIFGLIVKSDRGNRISVLQAIARLLIRTVLLPCHILATPIRINRQKATSTIIGSNVGLLVTDELSGVRVLKRTEKPVSKSMIPNSLNELCLADAYRYQKLFRLIFLICLGIAGGRIMAPGWFFNIPILPLTVLFLIPSLLFYVIAHARYKHLSSKQTIEIGPSWTTLFMRSWKNERR